MVDYVILAKQIGLIYERSCEYPLIDTHSHLADHRISSILEKTNVHLRNIGDADTTSSSSSRGDIGDGWPMELRGKRVKHVLVTCAPCDWKDAVNDLVATGIGSVRRKEDEDDGMIAVVGAGFHPWIVQKLHREVDDGKVKLVKEKIIADLQWLVSFYHHHHDAIQRESEVQNVIVGEIGLDQMDRHFTADELKQFNIPFTSSSSFFDALHDENHCMHLQLFTFVKMWKIAAEFHRPVSMHCVKSHELFIEFLKNEIRMNSAMPPTLALHSFTGNGEIVKEILGIIGIKAKLFVSISKPVTGKLSKSKLKALLSHVPIDRIIIESDEQHLENVSDALQWGVAIIVEHYQLSILQSSRILNQNAMEFLCHPPAFK